MRKPRRLNSEDAVEIINIAKKMIDMGEHKPFIARAVSEVMMGHDTLFSLFFLWDEAEDIRSKNDIILDMDAYLMY